MNRRIRQRVKVPDASFLMQGFAERLLRCNCGQSIAKLHKDRAEQSNFFCAFVLRQAAGQGSDSGRQFAGLHKITSS